MAGVEFTRFVVDIGTRILVSGAIGWMCFSVGLYFWDELGRRHLVRRRSRELRGQLRRNVKLCYQRNRWHLEDDLYAYRCQCGNLWFGDEQAGYSMGEECPQCDRAKYTDHVLADRQNMNPAEEEAMQEYKQLFNRPVSTEDQAVLEPTEEEAEDYYDRITQHNDLPERRRHAEEQGEYLQLASRED